MARCHRNDVGSLILYQSSSTPTTSGGHFRLWSTFIGSSFRRRIFDAVSCGSSSRFRYEDSASCSHTTASTSRSADKDTKEKPNTTPSPQKTTTVKSNSKSEKLSDLLNLADWSENEADAVATKRKMEALDGLKRVVRELQVEDEVMRREAASSVRSLTKEDLEARGTLAMLGAIPPLVGMLDAEDFDTQIAALYALLNLGIGNDM